MACGHIGKEPDSQGERLGKLADDFNGEHEGNNPEGNPFGDELFQVTEGPMLVDSGPLSTEKDDDRQRSGYVDIGSGGKSLGDQSQEITEEDEEEEGGDERKPCHSFLTDRFMDEVLFEIADHRFHQILQSLWDQSSCSSREEEGEEDENTGYPHHDDRIGDGEVDVSDLKGNIDMGLEVFH